MMKKYIYGFEYNGGYGAPAAANFIWATDTESAIKAANKRWELQSAMNPDPKTFRVASKEDISTAYSMFHT